jgi:ATP-dependent Clp protease adaptor protein ClpS
LKGINEDELLIINYICQIKAQEMIELSSHTKSKEAVDVLLEEIEEQKIILYNDEVNTFQFVIDSLIQVCNHDSIQAEQCTLLVHFKGKCDVKQGEYDVLEPMCSALLERGLTAEIE